MEITNIDLMRFNDNKAFLSRRGYTLLFDPASMVFTVCYKQRDKTVTYPLSREHLYKLSREELLELLDKLKSEANRI